MLHQANQQKQVNHTKIQHQANQQNQQVHIKIQHQANQQNQQNQQVHIKIQHQANQQNQQAHIKIQHLVKKIKIATHTSQAHQIVAELLFTMKQTIFQKTDYMGM